MMHIVIPSQKCQNYILQQQISIEKKSNSIRENPKTVFNCGNSSLSNFKNFKFLKQEKIEKDLKIKFSKKNFFVTLHPEKSTKDNFKNLSLFF